MLDGHNAYIAAAYLVTFAGLLIVLGHTVWQNKTSKQRLQKLEDQIGTINPEP